MNTSHSVDFVTTDDTKVGHSYLFGHGLLNQRDDVQLFPVPWELLANFVQPEIVYKVDKLQMPRQ